jgi:hypothetical protein
MDMRSEHINSQDITLNMMQMTMQSHVDCICMKHCFFAGIFRRVAVASMSLLHQCDDSFNMERVISMFHIISSRCPTLMVQWCNILILLNYGNKDCWSNLLQTPRSFLASVPR